MSALACIYFTWPAAAADYDRLRDELLARAADEQALRNDIDLRSGQIDQQRSAWGRVEVADRENTRWVKDVVRRYGWPTRSMIGEEGARAAWLLVQHADNDPAFQKQCLALIEELDGVVSGEELALLTDRVRIADGRPQLYGSQTEGDCAKGFTAMALEDAAHVDERRAAKGMPPLTEYLILVNRTLCSNELAR